MNKIQKILLWGSILVSTSLASEMMFIYDVQGKEIAQSKADMISISAKITELQKTRSKEHFFVSKSNKFSEVQSLETEISPVNVRGNVRWFEIRKRQKIKICPMDQQSSLKGVWVSSVPSYVDVDNYLSVGGINNTRSILVLFIRNPENPIVVDSNWILVDQKIVELSKKKHKEWVGDTLNKMFGKCNLSKYVDRTFDHDFIVDITEFTIEDAYWLNKGKGYNGVYLHKTKYPNVDSSKLLDYPVETTSNVFRYANWRSEKDGLEAVYRITPMDSEDARKYPYMFKNGKRKEIFIVDTSANGYRIPYVDEWNAMRQGAATNSKFYWGDSYDSVYISQYEWDLSNLTSNTLHPVSRLMPNPYGLYDVYSNAREFLMSFITKKNLVFVTSECYENGLCLSPDCDMSEKLDRQIKGGKMGISKSRGTFAGELMSSDSNEEYEYFYTTMRKSAVGFRLIRNYK